MKFNDGYCAGRVPDKRRFRAAIKHEVTGRVPFMETYVAEHIVDAVMGRPMGGHMLTLAAADYVEFLRRVGMDVGYLHGIWPLGRKNVVDHKGRVHYVDGTIKSRENLRDTEIPGLEPVKRRIEDFLEAAEGTGVGLQVAVGSCVTCVAEAIGPIDSLLAFHDNPAFVNAFMDLVERYYLPLVELVTQYPLEAIWTTGLQCMNSGPMISPDMHEKYIFPRMEKILDIIKPTGIPVILHTDGNNSQFMDWIVEVGFSGLHPIEPGIGAFNIYDIKKRYGERICLCGNIDIASVLSSGTIKDVRQDTLEHLDKLSFGGGYVCGSSHDIGDNIPFENFKAMVESIIGYQCKGQ